MSKCSRPSISACRNAAFFRNSSDPFPPPQFRSAGDISCWATLKATIDGMEAATGKHLLKQQILSATCKRNRQQSQDMAGQSIRMRSSHQCRARDAPEEGHKSCIAQAKVEMLSAFYLAIDAIEQILLDRLRTGPVLLLVHEGLWSRDGVFRTLRGCPET